MRQRSASFLRWRLAFALAALTGLHACGGGGGGGSSGQDPVPLIVSPAAGSTFGGGETLSFQGSATDAAGNALPASSLTWWAELHHDQHTHPFVPQSVGATGSATIPDRGETSANIYYRFHLRATDGAGRSAEVTRDVMPRTVTLSFATQPAGLRITLDGQPLPTPANVTGVVGMLRDLGAPEQAQAGRLYRFVSWSQGGAVSQTIVAPATNTSFRATFADVGAAPNQAPAVTLDEPAAGFTSAVGASITVRATASDGDGTVARVSFFDGVALIGEDTTAPYSVTWQPSTAGVHSITARATDNSGLSATSATASVTINPGGGDLQSPTLTLASPAHLASGLSGTVTLSASAADNIGVAGVEFQIDGSALGGEDTAPPYAASLETTAYPSGQHVIRARARDAAGNTSAWASATVSFGGSVELPQGFTRSEPWVTLSTFATATAMTQAADGRFFVALQDGTIRVVRNGVALPGDFHRFTVDSGGERGLLGIALHPDFSSNGWVYAYHTVINPDQTRNNRISRLVANGDVSTGAATTLVDLPTLSSSATHHNGGALHFGTDGKLYAAVGDNGNSAASQDLSSLFGKMLRFNDDGTVPSDNPFYATQSGLARSVWARGLRNPFTFAIQPGSGRMHINDVGQESWEEVDLGASGANYGWPGSEGPENVGPGITGPIFAYGHSPASPAGSGTGGFFTGIAVTGGVFYPDSGNYPAPFRGQYYFSDFGSGWLARMDLANANAVYAFGRVSGNPLGMVVGIDGALYVLTQQATIVRIAAP